MNRLPTAPTNASVIDDVAARYLLSPADIVGKKRDHKLVEARMLSLWLIMQVVPGSTLRSASKALQKDTSTGHYYLQAFAKRRQTDERLDADARLMLRYYREREPDGR